MDHYVHQLLREDLKHVIQWVAVAKQQLAVEVGVAGVAALRAAVEELTREQERVLKSPPMMDVNAHHIKIQTLEVVIQWVAVARQQQVVVLMEAVVKNVAEELRREHVQENQHIMEEHVLHIEIQRVVIQRVVALVRKNQVVEVGVDTVDVVEEVNIELDHASMYLQ